jgi:hypothetical protein
VAFFGSITVSFSFVQSVECVETNGSRLSACGFFVFRNMTEVLRCCIGLVTHFKDVW